MSTVAKRSKKATTKTTAAPAFQLPPGVMPGKESILAGEVQQIPVALIDIPKSKTDRQGMSDEELGIPELAQSIATVGMQQPILVAKNDTGRFDLIFGERRLRAVRLLKHERTSGIVRDATAIDPVLDQQLVEARAVENIHRLDPSPIGEALAIADIFEIKLAERIKQWREASSKDLADKGPSVSYMALLRAEAIARTADRVGKPIAWVRDRMFLSGFSGKARELVSSGKLPITHAREIAKVADPKRRDELAEEFAIGNGMSSEGQPGDIEDLRRQVASSLYSLAQVPWQLNVSFGGKAACSECPHNSTNNPGLFEGKQLFGDDPKQADKYAKGYHGLPPERPEPKAGVCTKPSCYIEKTAEANRAVSNAATKVINRYEPAKAAKKSDAAKLLSGSSIASVTPEFVKPSVVSERVNIRLESRSHAGKKTKPSASKHPQQEDYNSPRAVARRKGEAKFREADHHWANKLAGPAMAKYLNAKPARWSMFTVCKRTKAWERATTWNAPKKTWDSPDITRALRLLDNPSIEGFTELESMCGTRFGLYNADHSGRWDTGFVFKICKALGIELPEPPNEQKFIDAELAKLKTAEAPGKKPVAKKGAKDQDDDEEDE